MYSNNFFKQFTLLLVLTFSVFTAGSFAQTVTAEKSGSVAAYVRDREEDAGIVRQRVTPVENSPAKLKIKPSPEKILDFEKLVFALVNAKRAELGLTALAWSDEVAKVARLHSENMAQFNFFSHRGIDGKMVNNRADAVGLTKWTALGENIAYNRGFKDPLETAVLKWMESTSHRENILNSRWKESAIGIAVTDDGTYYFTQVFMIRK